MSERDNLIVELRKNLYDAVLKNKTERSSEYLSCVVVSLITLAYGVHKILGGTKESFVNFIIEGKDFLEDTLPSRKVVKKKKIIN